MASPDPNVKLSSSEASEIVDALSQICEAFDALARTLKRGETPHSHVSALLEKAERRTSSLRGTLHELKNFYETRT